MILNLENFINLVNNNKNMGNKAVISMGLPEEKIEGLRFMLIAIDSNMQTHYEFHNKAAK